MRLFVLLVVDPIPLTQIAESFVDDWVLYEEEAADDVRTSSVTFSG